MSIVDQLLEPMTREEFKQDYFAKQPYTAPAKAMSLRKLISWPLLLEIFATGHKDCWLPKEGRLPEDPSLKTGQLDMAQAMMGFEEGRTVLVRHAERAHPRLASIASEFHDVFNDPIDIQLYATPEGEEGFDWHYDIEEVFVIQSSGEKEFRLRKNKYPPVPLQHRKKGSVNIEAETEGPELRCLLKAGDWLYIPSGYWHKARAVSQSFHLSVGVMYRKDPYGKSQNAN